MNTDFLSIRWANIYTAMDNNMCPVTKGSLMTDLEKETPADIIGTILQWWFVNTSPPPHQGCQGQ